MIARLTLLMFTLTYDQTEQVYAKRFNTDIFLTAKQVCSYKFLPGRFMFLSTQQFKRSIIDCHSSLNCNIFTTVQHSPSCKKNLSNYELNVNVLFVLLKSTATLWGYCFFPLASGIEGPQKRGTSHECNGVDVS